VTLTPTLYSAEPKYPGCIRLAEILDLSHEACQSISLGGAVRPQRLEDEVKSQINLSGGTLSGDDSH